MAHIIEIGEVECKDGSWWTFMFWDGKLMQFSHGDDDNQISVGTLNALPFVEVLMYHFTFDVDTALETLEANEFDAAVEVAFAATKEQQVCEERMRSE